MEQVDINFDAVVERQQYVADRYGSLLHGSVLDVGCGERWLEENLPVGAAYTGIDIGGKPDIVVDLEQVGGLPFDDRQFDAVVCTDVLEHIDTLHPIFDELVRVADKHLIVSLPNCWRTLRRRISHGQGKPQYYGLPVERPTDRHKWMFNVDDIEAFMHAQTRRHPIEVIHMQTLVKPAFGPLTAWRKLMSGGLRHYHNRFAHSVFTVFARTDV